MLTRRLLEAGALAVLVMVVLFTDQVMRARAWCHALMITVLLGEAIAKRMFPTPQEMASRSRR
jgi:hypothetical protein